jgi:hypothetical protein
MKKKEIRKARKRNSLKYWHDNQLLLKDLKLAREGFKMVKY